MKIIYFSCLPPPLSSKTIGCPVGPDTCEAAASKGQVHVLKYLIEELACVCDNSTIMAAVVQREMDTLQYVLSKVNIIAHLYFVE